ncbi:BamA/TamA family outer membrane protein [Algoriphagus sp. SE2]|uniref:BamA/TamA family outer membrane protein n=1 Tax=Algoriphagus sp. SE2 TaxID=3141536 RepID=UPI0031CD35F9
MRKLLLITSLIFLAFQVLGQNNTLTSDTSLVEKKVDFTVMPYLSYNRNLDFLVGAIPMMMYKMDKNDLISPKSLSGLSAVYTTNGSYFLAFFNKLYLKEDSWRVQFFALNGEQNSQFFMDDFESPGFYDYGTKTTMVNAGVQRKIIPKLFVGISYTYAHYNTKYEDDVRPNSITETNGLQLNGLYDTRDEVYYPMTGKKVRLRWITFPEWFGNEAGANKILSEYNKYLPMRDKTDVLALRFSGKFGLGNIAFEQQVSIGGNDIRGYSEGKYRGDGLLAFQGEYRFNFNEKMGMVGFAGMATIYGSDTENFDWGVYPGAGIGYRYRAFKTVKFNIGFDAAVGKDDWGIYFRIGEAF